MLLTFQAILDVDVRLSVDAVVGQVIVVGRKGVVEADGRSHNLLPHVVVAFSRVILLVGNAVVKLFLRLLRNVVERVGKSRRGSSSSCSCCWWLGFFVLSYGCA